jgi:DNA polymerase-3 subunit epsilon
MYLVLDTETTGFRAPRQAWASSFESEPRVVQLGWEFFDADGHRTGAQCEVIRPDGFDIPADAERIHGISTEMANRIGVPIVGALDGFAKALNDASVLVAHNWNYDANVLAAEFLRIEIQDPFREKAHVCTMRSATNHCAIRWKRGYKWPRLTELHFKLFESSVVETHNAAADVATCAKCFFELKRLGVVVV